MDDWYLYENCHVKWKGRVTNLSVTDDYIRFDFLVGYHEEKVLEGVIPVIFDYAVNINPDIPIELIGRISIENGKLYLKGESLHSIIPEK